MPQPTLDEQLAGLCVLHEPVRRDLYRYVVARGAAVGRDEAAQAVGISRPLAAYHLDKLVAAGLLDVRFARLSGRRGPGAGRPAKLYERSARELQVSLPQRCDQLAAELLLRAVAADATGTARAVLEQAARRAGRELVATVDPGLTRQVGRTEPSRLGAVLAACGYEPYDDDGVVRLRNCPFQRLAADHEQVICRMNLMLLQGAAEQAGFDADRASLQPQPGTCCVAFAGP